LICVYHDDGLALSKHLARQCGTNLVPGLRQGQAGHWKHSDQW
jgi:hypothetical protein